MPGKMERERERDEGTYRNLGSEVIPNVTGRKRVLDEERYLIRHVQMNVL